MQSNGRKLTYITMVAIGNLRVQYNKCTVKQTYENVLNSDFKVTNGRPFYSLQTYGGYWLA